MEKTINEYFESLTDEELEKALELASYDYYNKIKIRVL